MKINPSRNFTWLQDPGHGWLSVPVAYLMDVCSAEDIGKISQYSYIKGKSVYLEEDCDAGIFIYAWKRKYNTFHYVFSSNEKRSPICSYDRFDKYNLEGILYDMMIKSKFKR